MGRDDDGGDALGRQPSPMPEFEWQFTLVLLTNGVMIGLMYALIALGFVLIYKATDAINFAQGEFVMMAGLIAAAVLAVGDGMLIAAIVATLAIMIGFGFGLERVVLRPLLGRPSCFWRDVGRH